MKPSHRSAAWRPRHPRPPCLTISGVPPRSTQRLLSVLGELCGSQDCANARCRIAADLIMTTRSRRWFLRLGAAWSAALVACRSKTAPPAAEPHALGAAVSPYGSRSRFEKAARHVNTNTNVPLEEASSGTPPHHTDRIITPASLHLRP